jgi:hypothetical protein
VVSGGVASPAGGVPSPSGGGKSTNFCILRFVRSET